MKAVLKIVRIIFILVFFSNISYAQTATFNYNTSTGTVGTTYSWIDCSGGTEITTFSSGDSDDGRQEINWPFAFRFYDDSYSTSDQLSIGTNGFIRLDGNASTNYTDAQNYNLTSSATSFGQIVALCLFDDNFGDAGSHLYYRTTGTTPNRILTVEYSNVEIDWNDGNYADVQVSFYETSNKVVIKFRTDDINKDGVDMGIHSGVSGYFNKWQEVRSGTNNTWIEYTMPPFIWDGSSSTSWIVAANWNRNALPTSTDDVLIPSGTPNNPQLPTNNHGYCKNLTINSGATLTVNNSKKNLNVYGDIINNGTLSVPGSYNILLRGKDNVIKGTGTYSNNVKLRLRDSNTKYALETDLDIYRFDMFSGDNNCVLNIGTYTLKCSNRVRNNPSAANCTINVTTGTIEIAGIFQNNGTINTGTGTIYYSGSANQDVIDIQYYNLKLGGSNTKKVLANLDVNGALTIESGSTLNSNSHTINVAGNWTNNGTFTQGTQTVTFDGSSAQTIGGSSTTTFYNLTLNNSAGITLNHTTNLSHTLTFTAGLLNTTSSNLLVIGSSATAVSGANSSRYIDGPVRKDGNSDFVFPVGDAGKYARIGISSLSGSDNFTAEYHNATPTNNTSYSYPITKVSDNEYWDLNRAGSSVTATVTLYWESSMWSGIGSFSDLRIMHYGSSWTAESGTYSHTGSVGLSAANSGTLSVTGVSSFSPFSFGTIDNVNNPLPIELLSFTAKAEQNVVLVEWQTASENNNEYFIIERSKDGINSERIGTVQGAGNSNEVLNYSLVDQHPYSGISYYRLIQVDYDGQSETFDWVAVNRTAEEEQSVQIFPNPLYSGNLNIDMRNIFGEVQLVIYDLNGRVVLKKNILVNTDNQKLQILIDLSNGVYNIQMVNKHTVIVKRLIVK